MYIRPFILTDRDMVRAMVFQEWLRHYVNPMIGVTEDVVRESHAALTNRSTDNHDTHSNQTRLIGFSNESENGIVAYGCAIETLDNIHLKALYVTSAHQGKGYGKTLLATLMAQHQNPKPWTLGVVTYNVKAIELYTSFGFRKTEREYYMGKIPIVEMVKR